MTLLFDLRISSKLNKNRYLMRMGLTFWFLSGDHRPDYLCMQKDGRTLGFLNKGIDNWVDVGQVKKTEGWDRANIVFADANGKSLSHFSSPNTPRTPPFSLLIYDLLL